MLHSIFFTPILNHSVNVAFNELGSIIVWKLQSGGRFDVRSTRLGGIARRVGSWAVQRRWVACSTRLETCAALAYAYMSIARFIEHGVSLN